MIGCSRVETQRRHVVVWKYDEASLIRQAEISKRTRSARLISGRS
jgi:hypothetical protein